MFRGLYWVLPGRFLAGEYPGSYDAARTPPRIRWLLQQGVTLFLDLTEEGEMAPYAAVAREEGAAVGRRVVHRRMPIRDHDVPTPEEMEAILDEIDAALEAGHTVYLHCWGGVGRTGTVVGCYLVRHGMAGEEALGHLAWLRRGTPISDQRSPETEEQEEMVKTWKEEESAREGSHPVDLEGVEVPSPTPK